MRRYEVSPTFARVLCPIAPSWGPRCGGTHPLCCALPPSTQVLEVKQSAKKLTILRRFVVLNRTGAWRRLGDCGDDVHRRLGDPLVLAHRHPRLGGPRGQYRLSLHFRSIFTPFSLLFPSCARGFCQMRFCLKVGFVATISHRPFGG